MTQATVARLLRDKYNIPVSELAKAAGVSQQYISGLELGKYQELFDYKKSCGPLMQKAFEGVAASRSEQVRLLTEDIARNSRRLLDFMEENDEL